ncbi:RPA-related protein RADX-like [Stegostoma tigrinum]|uniref:RPA-related protein RADX-like n=1 Tax=Stegostoma tigrinum TaxID=3053191 RepID=UPI00286FC16D|nr:RPA-related protein RADX-like [Stegostoma tigrinum]
MAELELQPEPGCLTAWFDRAAVFWVLAVERYLSDCPVSRYDVTLYGQGDGDWATLKYSLSPQLNFLVERNVLCSGCQLRVSRCSVLSDGFRVIERAEVLKGTMPPPAYVASLPIPPPLRCRIKYYLPLWEESDYYGEDWIMQTHSQEFVNLEDEQIIALKELQFNWRGRLKMAPLLVRVMYKSRLWHYGTAGKNIDWPYQAYFEVADSSGMMSVVLWNSLCPKFFRSLEVGTVILIQRYVVKDAFQMRTRPVSYYPDLKTYKEIDISLNPQKPAADIKIIPPKQVKPEWRLPNIKYRFITRDQLDTLPDTYVCDVIGLVTFVGRCERIRKKDNAFWVRRFVEMIDQTSMKPFILELYCTSQPDIYNQLHPVSFLVCTQMRVVRNNFHGGCSIAYLTSTSETQIYITGYHKGRPYTTDSTVRRFIQWAKSQHKTHFLEKSAVGGYYSFPPLPSNFQAYSQNMKGMVALVSLWEFKENVESLHYREHKHMVVQGVITAVKYKSQNTLTGSLMDKKHTQYDAGTYLTMWEIMQLLQSGRTELNNCTSNEYKTKMVNDQSSTDDYLHNISKTIESLESKEEDTLLARSTKYEAIQASTMKNSAPDLDPNSLSNSEETEDEYFTADEDISEMDEVPTLKLLNWSWESSKWSEIKSRVKEFLSFGRLLPESCPQKFEYAKKEAIMNQHNLQSSRCSSLLFDSSRDFATAWSNGYYALTIVDMISKFADAMKIDGVISSKQESVKLQGNIDRLKVGNCLNP